MTIKKQSLNFTASKMMQLDRAITYCENAIEFIECKKILTFNYVNIHVVDNFSEKSGPLMIIPKEELNEIFKNKLIWFIETCNKLSSIKNRVEDGDLSALHEFDEGLTDQMWHAWLLLK